ncbi:MAG: bifunctional nuclease family protein [Nitrospinota bacterium]
MDDAPNKVRVDIEGLAIDPLSNSPILFLKDNQSDKSLPIWVGYSEATAIATEIEKLKMPRPMTHDLLKSIIDHLGATITEVFVNSLEENTFYAVLELNMNGKNISIDARPSDAIAIAIRAQCPIYVSKVLLESATSIKPQDSANATDEEKEQFKHWIENIRPSDFKNFE